MPAFSTIDVDASQTVMAPDGSEVAVLCATGRGSMARFRLLAGQTARAVRHRTVEEIWFVVSGRGEIWRSRDGVDEVTALTPGICLTIPVGVSFQFRAFEALAVVAVTMPPWPGDAEAEIMAGVWQAG